MEFFAMYWPFLLGVLVGIILCLCALDIFTDIKNWWRYRRAGREQEYLRNLWDRINKGVQKTIMHETSKKHIKAIGSFGGYARIAALPPGPNGFRVKIPFHYRIDDIIPKRILSTEEIEGMTVVRPEETDGRH